MKKYFLKLLIIVLIFSINSCRENIIDPAEITAETNDTLENQSKQEIITPLEDETLKPGNKFKIKWNTQLNDEKMIIELVRKFDYIQTISSSTTNDGEFEWTIPTNLTYNHHYRIKLIHKNNLAVYVYSNEFNIE